jgi:hypothetical protein
MSCVECGHASQDTAGGSLVCRLTPTEEDFKKIMETGGKSVRKIPNNRSKNMHLKTNNSNRVGERVRRRNTWENVTRFPSSVRDEDEDFPIQSREIQELHRTLLTKSRPTAGPEGMNYTDSHVNETSSGRCLENIVENSEEFSVRRDRTWSPGSGRSSAEGPGGTSANSVRSAARPAVSRQDSVTSDRGSMGSRSEPLKRKRLVSR